MGKIERMNKALLEARKTKNLVAKNLLLTLKGEYETTIKSGGKEGDETLEAIAKKMVKSANQVGTDVAKEEITILSEYLPQLLSEEATRDLVLKVMVDNGPLVDKRNIGGLMGQVMKLGHKVDPKLVGGILNGELKDLDA